MPVRSLRIFTFFVVTLVAIGAIWAPFVALTVTLVPEWFAVHVSPMAQVGDGCELVVRLATFVVFGRWIYVAGSNLVAVGMEDLEFTPAARIWWFAVPFANFFKPYQGMLELWNASRGTWPHNQTAPLPAVWWACWLINGVIGQVLRLAGNDRSIAFTALYGSAIAGTALAATAIALVLGIARGQSALGREDLSAVFA